MNCYHIRRDAGFTLIEVLIALVVAVIGILAMIQLSGIFLKTVADSEQRTVAYAVAERTIENLRSFDSLSGSTAGESYFVDISSSTASLTVSSGLASYDFDIAWTIADNIVASSALTPGASGAVYRTLKQVDVVVSWDQPEAGSVSLSSYIGGIDPNAAALTVDNVSNIGGDSPDVDYTPGVAPEVIAVDVADGKLKETTKPLPEVSNKSQSTQVRFETITYTDSDELQLIQEDFLTVNCRCVLNTLGGDVVTPAYQKFEDANTPLLEVLGTTVSGATGSEASIGGGKSQSDFCGRCCANHHDTDNSSVKYSPLAGTASTGAATYSHGIDHPHYKVINGTSDPIVLSEAVHGDEYLEACRFKRINGIYRLVQDWELREINVFPSTYLASVAGSGLTDYVEYIKDYVKYQIYNVDFPAASVANAVLASTAAPSLASAPSLTLSTSEDDESISRAIYMDDITSVEGLSDFLLGLSAASVAEDTWLQFVPFNEINTTQLSLWDSNSTAIATVTNQTIDSVYNRGLIDAQALGSTSVVASMAQGNTGILGNTYNAEHDYSSWWNHITDISSGGRAWIPGSYNPMPVTVSGSAPSGTPYYATISGSIQYLGQDNLGTPSCSSSTGHGATLTTTFVSGTDPYNYTYQCVVGPVNSGDLYQAVVTLSVSGQRTICEDLPTYTESQVRSYPFGPTNTTTHTGNDFVVGKKDTNCP